MCGKGGRKPSLLSGSYYCVDLEVICNVAVMCPVNITLKCGARILIGFRYISLTILSSIASNVVL